MHKFSHCTYQFAKLLTESFHVSLRYSIYVIIFAKSISKNYIFLNNAHPSVLSSVFLAAGCSVGLMVPLLSSSSSELSLITTTSCGFTLETRWGPFFERLLLLAASAVGSCTLFRFRNFAPLFFLSPPEELVLSKTANNSLSLKSAITTCQNYHNRTKQVQM